MAFKLIESAQDRWRAVNAPHLVALVRAGGLPQRLRHVARWVSGLGARGRQGRGHPRDCAWAAKHLAEQLAEMSGEANKTISTIRMTMRRSLSFLADPALDASVLSGPGQSLDRAGRAGRTG